MDRLLKVNEVAEKLGISPTTVYSWCKKRLLPHVVLSVGARKECVRFREGAIDKWITEREREKGIYENHLIPDFGTIPLNRITVDQVEAYQARRKDEKRAASTINKEIQLLKNIAKKATEWGRIRGFQFAGVKPFKEPEGRVKFIDEDEQFDKLISALPSWLRPIAIISAFTGVRQGEVRTLRKRNIDKKRRQITL